eukprot:c18062_g1_i1 orf=490-1500(-)
MVTDDPLLVRWGLHDLLEGYSEFFSTGDQLSTGLGRTSVQTNDHARTEFVQPGESYPVSGFSTENDEVIAHALQEELSAAEGSEKSQDWRDWPGPFSDAWSAGGVAQNDYDPSSNCDYDSGQDSEDEGAPELSEDFATYDGEIGKRITHMDSIPHVPRINGEIPTIDDASAAHQRLFDRLKLYGLSELKVDGDGNCQFRAFSDQLYRTPTHHKSVRDDVVTQLTSHPEFYEGYVPMKYNDYVKKMARSGEWGDHVTLQAAADFYGVRICLLTSFKDTSFVQILPRQTKSKRVIFLSFWAEVHYNSVYAEGDVHLFSGGHKKKSRRWGQYFKDKLKI